MRLTPHSGTQENTSSRLVYIVGDDPEEGDEQQPEIKSLVAVQGAEVEDEHLNRIVDG